MTFIHEGNPNYVDKLVNFEKMVWLFFSLFTVFHGKSLCSYESWSWNVWSLSCNSECLPRQWKLFEDAEANLMVSESLMLSSKQLFTILTTDIQIHVYLSCAMYFIVFSYCSAVPSSPQRGLADRMFLDGPATRLSTCKLHLFHFFVSNV